LVEIDGKTFPVDTAKAYGIYLSEEDKIQLTEMIFEYFEKNGLKTGLTYNLILALTQSGPTFGPDWKVYIEKLLKIYQT
ncbi:hypothetical protein, partial [Neisseria gonorrhoeae]|uniref:hypothetical protein n=1 Tax=Neisseria gonorrhoeae TaxID=485 RepID=UPI0038504388